MREIKYKEITVQDANSAPLFLTYLLLIDRGQKSTHYGIKVIERTSGDIASALNVTTNANRIYDLMDKLVKNSVTPTTLGDIVADWL